MGTLWGLNEPMIENRAWRVLSATRVFVGISRLSFLVCKWMTWSVSRDFGGIAGARLHPVSGSGPALWSAPSRGCCPLCTFRCSSGACFGPGCVLDWLLTVWWRVDPDLPLVIRLSGQGGTGFLNLCTVGTGDSLLRALLMCCSVPSLTSTHQMPATSGSCDK